MPAKLTTKELRRFQREFAKLKRDPRRMAQHGREWALRSIESFAESIETTVDAGYSKSPEADKEFARRVRAIVAVARDVDLEWGCEVLAFEQATGKTWPDLKPISQSAKKYIARKVPRRGH